MEEKVNSKMRDRERQREKQIIKKEAKITFIVAMNIKALISN